MRWPLRMAVGQLRHHVYEPPLPSPGFLFASGKRLGARAQVARERRMQPEEVVADALSETGRLEQLQRLLHRPRREGLPCRLGHVGQVIRVHMTLVQADRVEQGLERLRQPALHESQRRIELALDGVRAVGLRHIVPDRLPQTGGVPRAQLGQDRAHHQRVAFQAVDQVGHGLLLGIEPEPLVGQDGFGQRLAFLALQSPQRYAVARRRAQPVFVAAAGDQHLAPAPAQLFQELLELLPVRARHGAVQPGIGRAAGGLEVVPDDQHRVASQGLQQRRPLLCVRQGHRVRAEERLDQAVEHVLGRADVHEGQPHDLVRQPLGLCQPLEVAACQRGLADASQAVHQEARRWPPGGPLQRQHRAVAADEAVRGLAGIESSGFGEVGGFRLFCDPGLAGELQAQGFLLVEHRHQPVLQLEACSSFGAGQHGLATGPDGFGHVA
ncbi:MAG: hypothetical protein ACREX8_01750 [Gammaproteobacteria bacterium]